MKDRIGIDIGGVIIKPAETEGDTSFFTNDYLETPMFEGAAETIRRLREERFGDEMYIVSKCGPRVQQKSLDWLEHHDFYTRTGLRRENVHFCRKRPEKAPICERLGISVFIDDRLDVLSHMTNVETLIQFCGSQRARNSQRDDRFEYQRCENWREVAELLLAR
ncbi:MAG: hypothetical protein AAGK01_11845 [Pseudomonadota bacterium]